MLSLLFVVIAVLLALAAQTGESYKLSIPRTLSRVSSTALNMEKLTHSQFYNQVRSSISEIDGSPYTVDELKELQDLIMKSLDRKASASSDDHSLQSLCEITKEACDAVTPMLQAFYAKITKAENTKGTAYFTDLTAKLKADATFFTIADGIVQHMFIDYLFQGDKFAQIVGEEDDTVVNLSTRPYTVDDLEVPPEFNELVELTLKKIKSLSGRIDSKAYKALTVFCDPIDGTREFATGKGECVTILLGYADTLGKPVAGMMYRPLTIPVTWAAGAASENCIMGHLDYADFPNHKGVLVTDGKVSPFINNLIESLGYAKINSLASGNRAMMLLEGKAGAYIRDTGGFAKWDTCAPEAVIEAYGGVMAKLPKFLVDRTLESYTHLKTTENLDFEEGQVRLSLSNAKDKSMIAKDETHIVVSEDGLTTTTMTTSATTIAAGPELLKEYACVSGLVALSKVAIQEIDVIHATMMKVKVDSPPIYN